MAPRSRTRYHVCVYPAIQDVELYTFQFPLRRLLVWEESYFFVQDREETTRRV